MLIQARDEQGRGLTDEQVRDQTLMLLAAGFETTSNALIWTVYLLARHPDVLARVRAELRAVLPPAAGSGAAGPEADGSPGLPLAEDEVTGQEEAL